METKGVESQSSVASRLNLVREVGGRNQAYLEITTISQHRRVVEVQGKAEPVPTVIMSKFSPLLGTELSGIYVAAAQVRVKPNHDHGAIP
jgi:hypothetical protein